jgi:peptidoglycan/LPS O-acetylase OafA/YrhL
VVGVLAVPDILGGAGYRGGGVALGALMSLADNAYEWDRPSVLFFVLPSRLCEFAIGGLAAYVFEQSRGVSRRAQEVVAGLGLVTVVVSFLR